MSAKTVKFTPLKNIGEEQPELYEVVLIVNWDMTDYDKAAYMLWNEGTEDECYNWSVRSDVGFEFEHWPYWARWKGGN